jgi:hypothetical protein
MNQYSTNLIIKIFNWENRSFCIIALMNNFKEKINFNYFNFYYHYIKFY